MAFDINYFLKINNASGTTSNKDIQLYNLKKQINDRFSDTIDFYTVQINNTNKDLLIIRTSDNNIKTIKARPNEDFMVGDCILWDGLYWLVISKDEGNQVYTSGKMQLCNFTIKFQSPNGAILSYPSIVTNRIQGSGDKEGDVLTLPDGRKKVILSCDESTILLRNDRRFFLDKHPTDPRPYKITFVDTTVLNYGEKGLIEVYCTEDTISRTNDRLDLGICDYFEPHEEPTPVDPTTPTVVVTINGNTTGKIILGRTHTYTASFTNELGEVISNTQPKFTIDNTYGGMVVLTDSGNGSCAIKVNDNAYDLITNQVTLTCMDTYSGFSSSISLTISGIFY